MQQFKFNTDNLNLNGWLHLPEAPCPGLVIGSHGLLSSGQSAKQIALAQALNALGIAYIRFDHRGVGQSAGDFDTDTTLENRTRDLIAVQAFVLANFSLGNKLGLFGSSFGGSTCLNAVAELNPAAIVTVAAPLTSADILPRGAINDPNLAFFKSPAKSFDIRPKLGFVSHALIIHGTADEIVPCAHSGQIYAAVNEPKELLHLKGADHTISDGPNQQKFMDAAVAWFKRFLA